MTRTNAGALTLAALLAASTATGALAQATTDEGQTDQAQTDEAETDQAPQGDAGAAQPADQAGGDTSQAAGTAEPMAEDAETGTDAQAGATADGGGTEGTAGVTAEEDANVTVIQEGGDAATEEAPAEGDATEAEVIEVEPADDATVVTEGGSDDPDTVIVTEPTDTDAAPVEGDAVVAEEAEVVQPVEGQIFEQSTDQVLGSTLLDATVVSPEGETIGDVTDMVVSADGQVTGVVIGVGGFLGIGEREVAVEYGTIEVRQLEGTDDLTFVLNATREELEAAPEFRTQADLDAEVPVEGTGATGEPVAVETDPNAVATEPAEPAETVIKPAD